MRDKPEWFDEISEMLTKEELKNYLGIWIGYEKFGVLPDAEMIKGNVKYIWPLTRRYIDESRRQTEPRVIRNSTEYRRWRANVYERDGYTCQICGRVGGELNAHHIKPFAKYPGLRFDVSNGVTLCKLCHKLVHSKRTV